MVEILHVTAAFGIKGAVRVFLYTDNIESYKTVYDRSGRSFSFRVQSRKKNTAVIKFDTINDRNEAENLRGESFYVNREDMPELGENQFYICDLIGQKVQVIGEDVDLTIVDVKNFGAGDLIEIAKKKQDGSVDIADSFFIPFTKENFVDKVSITAETYKNFRS